MPAITFVSSYLGLGNAGMFAAGGVNNPASLFQGFLGESVSQVISGGRADLVAEPLTAHSGHASLLQRVGIAETNPEALLTSMSRSQDYAEGVVADRTLLGHILDTFATEGRVEIPEDVAALRTASPVDPAAAKGVLAEPAAVRAPLFEDQTGSGRGAQAEIAAYFGRLMGNFPDVKTEQREKPGKKRPQTVLSLEGTFSAGRSAAIRQVTGNQTAGDGYLSRTDLFYEAIALIFKVVEHRLLRGQIPIHAKQIWNLIDRIPAGGAFRVETKSVDRRPDAPNAMVIIDVTFYGEGDRELATGRTMLAFAETMSLEPKTANPTTLGILVEEPIAVTEGLIDDYAEASGDKNIVHVNSAVARALGLKDRLLHGVSSDDMALGLAGPRDGWQDGNGDLGKTETLFGAPVYSGDTLWTYRNGNTVTVVNQRDEIVLTRTEK